MFIAMAPGILVAKMRIYHQDSGCSLAVTKPSYLGVLVSWW